MILYFTVLLSICVKEEEGAFSLVCGYIKILDSITLL